MKRPIENQLLLNKPKDKPKGGDPSSVRKGLAWLKADGADTNSLLVSLQKVTLEVSDLSSKVNSSQQSLNSLVAAKRNCDIAYASNSGAIQNCYNGVDPNINIEQNRLEGLKKSLKTKQDEMNQIKETLSAAAKSDPKIIKAVSDANVQSATAAQALKSKEMTAKTWMFIGIGVGIIILVGGIAYTARLFNKK